LPLQLVIVLAPLFERGQAQAQRRNLLPQMVVNVAGDAAPLVFLTAYYLAQQTHARLFYLYALRDFIAQSFIHISQF